MLAQRCPMASYQFGSQRGYERPGRGTVPHFVSPTGAPTTHYQGGEPGGLWSNRERYYLAPIEIGLPRDLARNPHHGDRRPSFLGFQGDAVPLIPQRPRAGSDEIWVLNENRKQHHTRNVSPFGPPRLIPTVINENCSIHGMYARRESRHGSLPKSISCPVAPRFESRQTANAERLKNWRKSSFMISGSKSHPLGFEEDDYENEAESNCIPYRKRIEQHICITPVSSISSSLTPSPASTPTPSLTPTPSPPPLAASAKSKIKEEFQCKRSHFLKAWSFFSIGCDSAPKEKPPPKRILRQPTRRVYRRGISGLPIECTSSRAMGMVF